MIRSLIMSFPTQLLYGEFGKSANAYAKGRRGFPLDVYEQLHRIHGLPKPRILDIGCGTGISARELARTGARVIGCDRDRQMLRIARGIKCSGVSYRLAVAERLPFTSNNFDVVTAFSAFHWFANAAAIAEIARVLKPGGVFFVVNKTDRGTLKNDYREFLRAFISGPLPDAKKDYSPHDLLVSNGFRDVTTRTVYVRERLSVDEAFAYLQSVSLWNLIPARNKNVVDPALRDWLENYAVRGMIDRPLQIDLVWGLRLVAQLTSQRKERSKELGSGIKKAA